MFSQMNNLSTNIHTDTNLSYTAFNLGSLLTLMINETAGL